MLKVSADEYYPYKSDKRKGKTSYLKMIPYRLQSTYLLVAVTSKMFFYGQALRKCPCCQAQLERYSHIQWEYTGLQPKVAEEEMVDVIRLRQNYFEENCDGYLPMINRTLRRIQERFAHYHELLKKEKGDQENQPIATI